MMRKKEKKAFVVEVQDQSYRTFVCDRWPVSVATLPNELLSSWLQRLAHANGIAPCHVASTLGLGNGFGPVKLEQNIPDRVASLLNNYTGMDSTTLAAMSFTGNAWQPLLLPLRNNSHRGQSNWLQYCPQCLGADPTPYFRRSWRLATSVSCAIHRCVLKDRCLSCGAGIAAFGQRYLIPPHLCASCHSDLRNTPAGKLRRTIRNLACALNQLSSRQTPSKSSALILQLLDLPAVTTPPLSGPFIQLSTAARIRRLDGLVQHLSITSENHPGQTYRTAGKVQWSASGKSPDINTLRIAYLGA